MSQNSESTDNIVQSTIDKYDEKSAGKAEDEKPADFETAIKAAGFGKFNVLLLTVATTAGMATVFESTTMSYVFPAAQCDLNLSLTNKGVLNAVTYSGMVVTSIIWGFLCDTLGRRNLLVAGFLLDTVFCIVAATSQSFQVLATAKFLGGAVINGPYSALSAYMSETHNAHQRARTQLYIGYSMSLGGVVLPVFALYILPKDIHIEVGTFLVLRSWNIFIFMSALPALISGIIFMFLPESPKFLTTAGRYREALEVYKTIYKMNTGNPKETFPIKELMIEGKVDPADGKNGPSKKTNIQVLMDGFKQMKPIVFPPHLVHLFLVLLIQHLIMLGTNAVRLWLPQLFQAVVNYEHLYNKTDALCTILNTVAQRHGNKSETCVVDFDNAEVYTNSIIVAVANVAAFVPAGFVINVIGKKMLLHITGFVACIMAVAVSFSQNNVTTVSLVSIEVALGIVATNVTLGVVVELFPTTLRSMAVALTMMFGRMGGALGNIIFPYMMMIGCMEGFVTMAVIMAASGVVPFFLPKTDLKPLT